MLSSPMERQCSKQHILLCPQFETTGQCDRGKKCHLTHRRKRQETDPPKKKPDLNKCDDSISSPPTIRLRLFLDEKRFPRHPVVSCPPLFRLAKVQPKTMPLIERE